MKYIIRVVLLVLVAPLGTIQQHLLNRTLTLSILRPPPSPFPGLFSVPGTTRLSTFGIYRIRSPVPVVRFVGDICMKHMLNSNVILQYEYVYSIYNKSDGGVGSGSTKHACNLSS